MIAYEWHGVNDCYCKTGRVQCMECLCDRKYGSQDAKVEIDNREWVIPSG